MGELYLRYFEELDANIQAVCTYIVLIDHSSCIGDMEALFRAQKEIINKGFMITKVEYPYIHCTKMAEEK